MINNLIIQINTHTIPWKISKPKKLSINGLKSYNNPSPHPPKKLFKHPRYFKSGVPLWQKQQYTICQLGSAFTLCASYYESEYNLSLVNMPLINSAPPLLKRFTHRKMLL